ncbi:MAG: hypothetical protein CO013_10840 [Syntrophobacterales bacterium CG_4_8_14_3_um_filter_58_8]|nr:MAG: hypothetical protein AUK26_07780 [Syntrophaceae bacterium CG2_30_58_14]PIV01091.1 MAG: hypothetical protein COS57_14895 [Syntrophobacterales bacterium CG03_land_8_20_14_0_80_58_14]PJC72139.1 MAG: hypothetical protein CO013_10840 [Syntrophobacterales bacterium CG_4_8_14_3_um_filter_58_8]
MLRLPPKIQDSVKKGGIGVSQGYPFAANLENPGLMTVFEDVLVNPVANRRLTKLLKKARGWGGAGGRCPGPFQFPLRYDPDGGKPPGEQEGPL